MSIEQVVVYIKKGILTLCWLLFGLYVFVILASYSPNDPSWSHVSTDMGQITNMGGTVGAWLADILLTLVGVAAYWLVLIALYEAARIWWDRQGGGARWALVRVVSYLFLLMSTATLLYAMNAWWEQSKMTEQAVSLANQTSLDIKVMGVVGYELGLRLQAVLGEWGGFAFSLLFSVALMTIAFEIYWQAFFTQLVSLKWLGRGLQQGDDLSTYQIKKSRQSIDKLLDNDQHVHQQHDDVKPDTTNQDSRQQNSYVKKTAIATRQIPLPLSQQQTQADNPPDLHTQTTGIISTRKKVGSYLRQFVQQTGLKQDITEQTDNTQSTQTTEKNTKVVQSGQSVKPNSPAQKKAQQAVLTTTDEVMTSSTALNIQQPFDNRHASIDSMNAVDDYRSNQPTWNNKDKEDKEDEESPFANLARLTDSLTTKDDSPQIHELSSRQPLAYGKDDFTPNNTPPANPLKPHENNSLDKKQRPLPNVRFDVPEGEDSNRIINMVDDDNDNDDVSMVQTAMADIHDDMAFVGKSRAMQTAKYRANLPTLPPLSLLDEPAPDRSPSYTSEKLQELSELLEIKLQEFNIKAEVVTAIPGPVVTRFEVDLAAGVKASKVVNIARDLARSLSMASLRVVEVIPGKPYIGIEVPNKKREMVRLIELLATDKYQDPKGQISMAMGKDIGGKPIITDLAKAPHMLVAGTTGSGKSVLVNSMLLSILLKYTPEQLRLILIDPKQLELANYNDIPHLLTPVVTDMTEAASSLSWCVAEMERRYQLMSLLKVRKLKEFNKKVIAAQQAGNPIIDPLWRPNDSVSIDKAPKLKTLPLIVIVADEFADMIMQVGKQAEELITRLAQKSRAAGIHLMLATQRPSVDVITGLIKANVPVRVALRVNSKVDSRTILDSGGAEDMLGNGDMLFLGPGQIEPERVHGAFVSDEEVNRVCEAWRERGKPDYIDNFSENFDISTTGNSNTSGEDDELYNEAVAFIMETRKVSASSLQRKFSIGYNRAARIVDSMEKAGLISPMDKSGKRELLF